MQVSHLPAQRTQWVTASGIDKILPHEAADNADLCFFNAGESLCEEGDESPCLLFVLLGRYKLTRLTSAGQECLLRFFDAFSLIGELELLRSGPCQTNAIALTETVCLRLSYNRWRAALLDYNPFLRFLCSYLGYKTAQRSQNLTLSLGARVPQRTASYILASAQDNFFCENRLHLAEFLGCSHRQLLRAIADFCRSGLLRREGSGYRIIDPQGLRARSVGVYAGEPFRYPGLHPVNMQQGKAP